MVQQDVVESLRSMANELIDTKLLFDTELNLALAKDPTNEQLLDIKNTAFTVFHQLGTEQTTYTGPPEQTTNTRPPEQTTNTHPLKQTTNTRPPTTRKRGIDITVQTSVRIATDVKNAFNIIFT